MNSFFLNLRIEDKVGTKKQNKLENHYEMASGGWPVFSQYEIKDINNRKFICPRKDAKFRVYDPWEKLNKLGLVRNNDTKRKIEREKRTAYTRFIDLFDDIGFNYTKVYQQSLYTVIKDFVLNEDLQKILCDWCAKSGLLGILFQELRMLRFPFMRDRNMYSAIIFKMQGKWQVDSIPWEINPVNDKNTQQSKNKSVKAWRFLDWESGHAEMESFNSSSLFMGRTKYHWSSPDWILKNYFPQADSFLDAFMNKTPEEIWRGYCEPLDLFWFKGAILGWGLHYLTQSSLGITYERGVHSLNEMIGEVPVSFDCKGTKVAPKLRTPSLLSAYAHMALEDVASDARLLRCNSESCRRWFTARHKNAKFCSPGCNSDQQQLKSRRKKKKKDTPKNVKRKCETPGCNGSMDGRPKQARYCTNQCGNTFRTKERRKKEKGLRQPD